MGNEQPALPAQGPLAPEPVTLSPSAAADEKAAVTAESLLDTLRRGEAVSLENARIVGPLDLRNVQILGHVSLTSCEIEDFADFSYAVFDKTLRLQKCTFRKGVSFDSARLNSDVFLDETTFGAPSGPPAATTLFNDAEFKGVVSAPSVRFTGGAATSFQRVRFGNLVILSSARFEGDVDLSHLAVSGDLYLNKATFLFPCSLERAIVTGDLVLSEARFSRRAHISLRDAQVDRAVLLASAVVLGHLYAAGARLGSVEGSQAVFARGLALNDTAVAGSVNLSRARFGRRYAADLRGLSVGGQLVLTEALIKAPLQMDDAVVKRALVAERSRFLRWATFDRLQAGGVNLTGARFESRLLHTSPHFKDVTVSGVFTASKARFARGIEITNSKIGELTFDDVRSYGTVDLGWTTVSGILSFAAARIRGSDKAINLQGVHVGKVAWFDNARFAGKVFAIGLHVEQQFSWNNVIAIGDVDFYELEVTRGAFLQSATFGGALKLDRAHLAADVYLSGTVCRGRAGFEKARIAGLHLGKGEAPHDRAAVFNGGIAFQYARLGFLEFHGVSVDAPRKSARSRRAARVPTVPARPRAMFSYCEISGVANFVGAKVKVPADFTGTTFVGDAVFTQAEFSHAEPSQAELSAIEQTSFRSSTFRGRAVFHGTQFEAGADFSHARFENLVSFRARFDGRATFDMTRFLSVAEFSDSGTTPWEPRDYHWAELYQYAPGSSFADASFVQARFSGEARFDNAKFSGELDLREATFATLYLPNDSDPRTESRLLPAGIGLVGCRYDHVVLKHPCNLLLHHEGGLRLLQGYDRQPFTQLESTLRRAGDDRAADEVYLSCRRAEGRQKPAMSRLFDRLYGLFVNYGVRPWRLAAWAFLCVTFGTWFFSLPGTVQLKDKDPPAQASQQQTSYQVTWEEAVNMGVAQFIPVPLPIKDRLTPTLQPVNIDIAIPAYGRVAVLRVRPTTVGSLLQLAGWVLVPIGVAAITGVLMRKSR